MALSVMINLDELLFAAYNLGLQTDRDAPTMTKTELRAKLFENAPLVGNITNNTDSEKIKTEKPKAEKKPKAEPKPKAEKPVAELCSARAFYEKEHIEDGKLKVMCDDETNQFGGRCKFKQSGESKFCKHHSEKQPHGVWGGEYAGKLKSLIEKANAPVEDKPKAEDKPKKKVVKKVVAASAESETEEPKTPTKPQNKTKPVEPKAPKRPAKAKVAEESDHEDLDEDPEDEYMAADGLEKANVEYEWITIDDQDYMISGKDVYDPETEEKIGTYDTKAKKWIQGGPKNDE